MTFEEYKTKRAAIDEYILKCLKHDSSRDVLYQINLYDRLEGRADKGRVFKQFCNLEEYIEDEKITYRMIDSERYDCSPKCGEHKWWQISKCLLINGEYEDILRCDISLDGELLHFWCTRAEYFNGLYKNQELTDVMCCKNVVPPYETGDIIKFNNLPLMENFYAIYGYDEQFKRYNHFYMCCGEENMFSVLYELHKTETAETCPNAELNEMSRKIKENPELFHELIMKHGVTPF